MSDDIYDDFEAYEIAYSFRDIEAECDFLVDVVTRRRGQRPRASVELGCGPAAHSRELASRGVRAYAVDTSAGALAYLARVAPRVTGVLSDMRSFRLPEQVDLAFCPLNTFAYLLTDHDWLEALGAVAEALRPRGMIVLEFVLADAFRREPASWTCQREGVRVSARAGPSRDEGEGVYAWDLHLVVERPEGTCERSTTERQRTLTPALIDDLLRRSGAFSEITLYADYDLRRRWHGEDTVVATARRS